VPDPQKLEPGATFRSDTGLVGYEQPAEEHEIGYGFGDGQSPLAYRDDADRCEKSAMKWALAYRSAGGDAA
jgi:hypothetical protein